MTQRPANRIEEECRARGLRLTGQRRVIARVLSDSKDHPDAPELHRRAVLQDPRVSLPTVYRTVKLLEEAGIIARHAFRDGRSRYEGTDKSHHDHLIDLATGRVIEFTSPEIEQMQAEIARKLGYTLVGHRLELYAEPIAKARAPARRPAARAVTPRARKKSGS